MICFLCLFGDRSDEKELLFESVCATLLSCWMSVGLSLRHLSRFKEGRPNLVSVSDGLVLSYALFVCVLDLLIQLVVTCMCE